MEIKNLNAKSHVKQKKEVRKNCWNDVNLHSHYVCNVSYLTSSSSHLYYAKYEFFNLVVPTFDAEEKIKNFSQSKSNQRSCHDLIIFSAFHLWPVLAFSTCNSTYKSICIFQSKGIWPNCGLLNETSSIWEWKSEMAFEFRTSMRNAVFIYSCWSMFGCFYYIATVPLWETRFCC